MDESESESEPSQDKTSGKLKKEIYKLARFSDEVRGFDQSLKLDVDAYNLKKIGILEFSFF